VSRAVAAAPQLEPAERTLLRALLAGAPAGLLHRIRAALSRHEFSDPLHRLLFDCLRQLGAASPTELREHLPALLVRRGFPDFTLDDWFAAPAPAAAAVGEALEQIERHHRGQHDDHAR
jgi:hypothetical protein